MKPIAWYCQTCNKFDLADVDKPMAKPEHIPYRGIDIGLCKGIMIPLYDHKKKEDNMLLLCPLRRHMTKTQVTLDDDFKECMEERCAWWIRLNPEAKVDINVLHGCALKIMAMKLRYGGGEISGGDIKPTPEAT